MDRYEESKKVFNELFGALPDKDSETDNELMEILRKFIFGDVFNSTNIIDFKTRELITITILGTLQTLPQLKAHIKSCLKIGVSPITIREAMYQLAPFIGFPKTLNAVAVMNEAFTESNIALPLEKAGTTNDENRFKAGYAIQNPIYGDEIKAKFFDIPQIPQFLTEFGFGDFYTREGLSLKMRELLVLIILTTIKADSQIEAHILGNLKLGNSKEIIIASMIQCIGYIGFPNAMNTLSILKKLEGK